MSQTITTPEHANSAFCCGVKVFGVCPVCNKPVLNPAQKTPEVFHDADLDESGRPNAHGVPPGKGGPAEMPEDDGSDEETASPNSPNPFPNPVKPPRKNAKAAKVVEAEPVKEEAPAAEPAVAPVAAESVEAPKEA